MMKGTTYIQRNFGTVGGIFPFIGSNYQLIGKETIDVIFRYGNLVAMLKSRIMFVFYPSVRRQKLVGS
jgi:hypothetical protein